jgi:hypothetical protein
VCHRTHTDQGVGHLGRDLCILGISAMLSTMLRMRYNWASYLKGFGLIIAFIDTVLILARAGGKLSSVNRKGSERKGSISVFDISPMLELHDS